MAYTTIDKPKEYHSTTLWTADDSSPRSLSGFGHRPDWLWGGHRDSGSTNPNAVDSSRGGNKNLTTATTAAEDSGSHGIIDSFDSDGITVSNGTNSSFPRLYYNELDPFGSSGGKYAYWHWRANAGSTSSNSDGSITTTVQANTTAGFSIVLYTSASGGQTIGHGLGGKPEFYIIKERGRSGDDWMCYHSYLGAGKKVRLSGTGAAESDTNIWQNTEPTTTVASLQNDGGAVNQSSGGTGTYLGYFFRSIKGYSKIGHYQGNGDADGPFIYLGFKPAWFMTKNITDSGDNWIIVDSARSPFNVADQGLAANTGTAEFTDVDFDFLSNGVKCTNATGRHNGGGDQHIFMAFAENPFVSSKGIPAKAK